MNEALQSLSPTLFLFYGSPPPHKCLNISLNVALGVKKSKNRIVVGCFRTLLEFMSLKLLKNWI